MSSDSDILRTLQELEARGQGGAGIVERQIRVVVWFYPWAVKDDLASRKEGRSIYRDAPYCARKVVGATDYMSGPASPQMIAEYPQEWLRYTTAMASPKTSISHLPGVETHPSVLKYCEEAEIRSIEDLAAAPEVVPELIHAQALAKRWVTMSNEPAIPVEVAKKRGGRVKGSKNKPKAITHAENTKAVA